MFESIMKLFSKKEEGSKNVAKERLKLVLVHDKANVSPQFLEMVKGEIIKVIEKYMEIDENCLEMELTKIKSEEGDRLVPVLTANIPILNVKQLSETKEEVKEEIQEQKETESKTEEKKPESENKIEAENKEDKEGEKSGVKK